MGNTAYSLPWWMQWAQAIALLIISCVGAWIAYRQARIAAAKLNFDLFEKRFKVFEAARNCLATFIINGKFSNDDLLKYNFGVIDAVFLFDPDVTKYLDGLKDKIFQHRTLDNQISKLPNDSRQGEWVEAINKIEVALGAEHSRLVEVFKPYLKLGNI